MENSSLPFLTPFHCISCIVIFHPCHHRKSQWHRFLVLFQGWRQQQRWECQLSEKRMGRVLLVEKRMGSCPVPGWGFWALGFWTMLKQHKDDCCDYFFLGNWNLTYYLHFEFEIGQAVGKQTSLKLILSFKQSCCKCILYLWQVSPAMIEVNDRHMIVD